MNNERVFVLSVVVILVFVGVDPTSGLGPPNYISQWTQMDAADPNKREFIFNHNFDELPVKVEVQVDPNLGENAGYYFAGIGSAQSSYDVINDVGGVVYFYDELSVVVKSPNAEAFGSNGNIAFTGEGWTTKNSEKTQSALVRVRAWRKERFPDPVFSSTWLPISVIDASMTYLQVNATNGTLQLIKDMHVSVRIRLVDGPLVGKVCDAQGTSMAYVDGIEWGGVVYKVDGTLVQIWAPFHIPMFGAHGSLCNMAGGWGAVDSGYGLNGEVQVEVFDLEYQQYIIVTTGHNLLNGGNSFTFYNGSTVNTKRDIVYSIVYNNDLAQGQEFWPPVGGVLFPDDSSNTFGGVVFAYRNDSFRVWSPTNQQTFYLDTNWGHGNTTIVRTNTKLYMMVFRVSNCVLVTSAAQGYNLYDYGTTVTLACSPGMVVLTGDLVLTCGHHGWNGTQATCIIAQCDYLPEIDRATLVYSCTNELVVGCEATYACETGYTINGTWARDTVLSCMDNQLWHESVPSCDIVDCGNLTIPVGAVVSGNETTFLSQQTVACDTGYVYVSGDTTRLCNAYGVWRGHEIVCDLVDCGSLTSPSNGTVTITSTTYGGQATYTCNVGFTLSGLDSRVCETDGLWNGTEPTCKLIDCGSLASLGNGTIATTSTTYGGEAIYTCDIGFLQIGHNSRMCDADGYWNGTQPTCELIDCGSLASPANGTVTLTSTKYGGEATYTCNVGFTLTSLEIRVCEVDGLWNGIQPSCELIDCGSLTPPAYGTVSHTSTTYGGEATFTCDVGFTMVGLDNQVCGADSLWNGTLPICDLIDCGSLIFPAHGIVTSTSTTYGGETTYSCNVGFTLAGHNSRVCGADGFWNGTEPTCDVIDCGSLASPTNGTVTLTSTMYAGEATYTCNVGFTLSGLDSRVCEVDGLWNGTEPTCEHIDCGKLTIPGNGTVAFTSTTYSGQATYNCNVGFTLTGLDSRTCDADGLWNGTQPTCDLIDCGSLASPANGTVALTSTTYGEEATSTCNVGFTLVGLESRVCGADGTWNGTQPTCDIIDCGSLTTPANGTVTLTSTTYDEEATYTCNVGFTLIGLGSRVCDADGIWNGTQPSCELIDCGSIQTPVNGTFTTTNGSYFNSVVSYTCAEGYMVVGSDVRTCTAYGVWSGTQPTCEPEVCLCKSEDLGEYFETGELTVNELAVVVEEIIAELTVDKTLTSKSVRAKTSAHDHRTSSTVIGYAGILFVCVVFGLILLIDCIRFCQHFASKSTSYTTKDV